MKATILLLAFLCLLLSCSKTLEFFSFPASSKTTIKTGNFTEFIILKGEQFSRPIKWQQVNVSRLRFQVLFDSSAIYSTSNPENQYDINKLYGFSDCASNHHGNSARFGWRWNGNAVEIHAYWYSDSIRFSKFLDTVSIGKTYELALGVLLGNYVFEVKNQKLSVPRHCRDSLIHGYQLYPYFGGDEPAPHDIRIKIKPLASDSFPVVHRHRLIDGR